MTALRPFAFLKAIKTYLEEPAKINFIGKAGENDMTLAIIGGGPAGHAAAVSAAQQGRNVSAIDKGSLGGTCLNEGAFRRSLC